MDNLYTIDDTNQYQYQGLPPGPICLPNRKTLEKALNYESHKYLFFCAKEDFSGYHNFATTYSQHLNNARRYQRQLSRRGILK